MIGLPAKLRNRRPNVAAVVTGVVNHRAFPFDASRGARPFKDVLNTLKSRIHILKCAVYVQTQSMQFVFY